MRIRRWREADRPELVRMSLALFPEGSAEGLEGDIDVIAGREDAEIFVVERSNGLLCGFVEVGSRPYVDGCDSSPVGYIEAWYVDDDVRRTGIGRTLLNTAEDWAVARGYTEMGSDSLLANEVSYRAHRASGYDEVDRVVQYRKDLNAVPVSARVTDEATQRLAGADAARFLARLARTRLPMLDPWNDAREIERIHLALLSLVERDLDRLDYHLAVAAKDWRDTLGAGER